jgi:hypothetical protein
MMIFNHSGIQVLEHQNLIMDRKKVIKIFGQIAMDLILKKKIESLNMTIFWMTK